MWKMVSILVLLLLTSSLSAQDAVLDSVTHCQEYEILDNEADGSIDLNQFDPVLGRLVAARIDVELQNEHTLEVENTATGDVNLTIRIIADAQITPPQNSPTPLRTTVDIDNLALATFDGTIDFAGASGESFDQLIGSGGASGTHQASVSYTDPDETLFVGNGSYSLPLSSQTSFDVGGSRGNSIVNITTTGKIIACVTYYYVREADLSLTKAVSANNPAVGDTIEYILTVSNAGPTAASAVLVRDVLPSELSFVSADPDDYDPALHIWNVGALGIDASKQITLTARVVAGNNEAVSNTAQVSVSDLPDPDSTPNNDDPTEDDQDQVDVTLYRLGSIGDYVWYDDDRNGVQDGDENGVDGIGLDLLDENGMVIHSTTTNVDGLYLFENIHWGTYQVRIDSTTLPEDYGVLGDDFHDLTLNPGEDYLDADFPIAKKFSRIGDRVWWDKDNDSVQDAEEPGFAGVRVIMETIDGTFDTTYTDDNGNYIFTDIPPTQARVFVDSTTIPRGYELTSGDNPSSFIDLPPGTTRLDLDYGYHSFHGSIGDLVWYDLNKNGIPEEDEPGIPNITVYLFDQSNNTISKTLTNEDGEYLFKYVPSGEYMVYPDRSDIPKEYQLTTDEEIAVSLDDYEQYRDADFGFWSPSAMYLGEAYREVLAWYDNPLSSDPQPRQSYEQTDLFAGNEAQVCRYEYDILLAWLSGIDGFVVEWYGQENRVSNPSTQRLMGLLETADELYRQYGQKGFDFQIIAVLQEDAIGSVTDNLAFLADSVVSHPAYFGVREQTFQPLFVYNTDQQRFEPESLKERADEMLPPTVLLGWNEGYDLSVFEHFDLLYPWVQPMNKEYDHENGSRWGDTYLDFEYDNMNVQTDSTQILFAIGTVWPGYDEGPTEDGARRWISPQDTAVYRQTWEKIFEYDQLNPMGWALIESWNVFAQKTDIISTLENRYTFLRMTSRYSQQFKGLTAPRCTDDLGFIVPQKIRQARIAAAKYPNLRWQYNFAITRAMANLFEMDYFEAISIIDQMLGIHPLDLRIAEIGGSYIDLEWEQAPQANAYHVFYSTDPGDFTVASRQWPQSVTVTDVDEFRLSGLTVGETYHVAVTPADTTLDNVTNYSWYQNLFTSAEIKTVQLHHQQDPTPNPNHTDNRLVFVRGSATYAKGNRVLDWNNAVDGDIEGWDGTVLTTGDATPSDDAWAIFKFADGAMYQFDYIATITDNGTDDNANVYDYQTRNFEVWVSTSGEDPADFTRVVSKQLQYDGRKREWTHLDSMVQARYVMLRLTGPNYYPGGWRQLVEFEVHTRAKKGAVPAASAMTVVEQPRTFSCSQNYPNPFNPVTTIEYAVPEAANVTLRIYNVNGQLVETLVDGYQSAGVYRINWRATRHPSGVYFYRLTAGNETAMRRMMLLK
jgi:uncharacterized repeat protein (TIGR01451 family)